MRVMTFCDVMKAIDNCHMLFSSKIHWEDFGENHTQEEMGKEIAPKSTNEASGENFQFS